MARTVAAVSVAVTLPLQLTMRCPDNDALYTVMIVGPSMASSAEKYVAGCAGWTVRCQSLSMSSAHTHTHTTRQTQCDGCSGL